MLTTYELDNEDDLGLLDLPMLLSSLGNVLWAATVAPLLSLSRVLRSDPALNISCIQQHTSNCWKRSTQCLLKPILAHSVWPGLQAQKLNGFTLMITVCTTDLDFR